MTCKNCGSNDIIAIQDQNYCINCGQLAESKSGFRRAKKVIAPQTPSAIDIKGSPKSPQPTGVPLIKDGDLAPRGMGEIISRKADKSGNFTRKPLLDLRESISNNTDESTGSAPKAHAFAFVMKLALGIAIPASSVLALALYLKVDTDLILYGAIAGSVLAGLSVMILHAALLYGGSKARDGRIVAESQWWLQAKSRFTEILLINVVSALGITILSVAVYGFYAISLLIPSDGAIAGIVFLLAANTFVSWLVIGLLCIRRLTIAIVTIGGQPAVEAMRMAWNMYGDYGGHLILSAAETSLVKLMAAVTVIVIGYCAYTFSQSNATLEPLAYGLAALVSIVLWLVVFMRFEVAIWLTRYRWIAGKQPARTKAQLLAGGAVQ